MYHHGRYVSSRTFDRKRDAQQFEAGQKLALAAGSWVHPDDATLLFSDWVKIWQETKGGKPTSRVTRETMLRRHVLPAFGRKPLSLIRSSDVETFVQKLEETRSVATAHQALVPLRQSLHLALREGLIQRDPTAGIKLRKPAANEPMPLTHAQVWSLADAAACESDRTMLLTFAYSGCRWGEISALRRRNVLDGRLRLTHAFSETGGKLLEGSLKNHQARTVPLPTVVHAGLLSLAKRCGPDDLIFHTANGTAYRNGNWRRSVLNPALEHAELPRLTPHNFRDTAASLAIEAGASVVAVARMLGHEDASTTLRHYASLFPDTFDGITDRMNAAIEQLSETPTEHDGD